MALSNVPSTTNNPISTLKEWLGKEWLAKASQISGDDAPKESQPASVPANVPDAASATSARMIARNDPKALQLEQQLRGKLREPATGGVESVPIKWDAEAGPQVQSNSPETLHNLDGLEKGLVGVSTLNPVGQAHPEAHLGQAIDGPFSIAASHNNRSGRTAYQNLVVQNPSDQPVTVEIEANAARNSRSSPYVDGLPGTRPFDGVLSGPGASLAHDEQKGVVTEGSRKVVVPPHGTWVLRSEAHGRGELMAQVNGRSSGPLHAAVLYSDRELTNDKATGSPAAAKLLQSAKLLPLSDYERKVVPSPSYSANQPGGFRYGRVAGVAEGYRGQATLSNDPTGHRFVVYPGQAQTYDLLAKATSKNVAYDPQSKSYAPDDSAPALTKRYPHSAYKAHGAYFTDVRGSIPLDNPSSVPVRTRVYLDGSPDPSFSGTRTFRGTINSLADAKAKELEVELSPGTRSQRPFIDVVIPPGSCKEVGFELANGANNTAPLRLRIESVAAE